MQTSASSASNRTVPRRSSLAALQNKLDALPGWKGLLKISPQGVLAIGNGSGCGYLVVGQTVGAGGTVTGLSITALNGSGQIAGRVSLPGVRL